jgi:hypothetical protein
MKHRTIVSMHVTPDDLAALERLLDGIVNVTRHSIALAALRAGLAQFTANPATVLPHLGEHVARRARLRAST